MGRGTLGTEFILLVVCLPVKTVLWVRNGISNQGGLAAFIMPMGLQSGFSRCKPRVRARPAGMSLMAPPSCFADFVGAIIALNSKKH